MDGRLMFFTSCSTVLQSYHDDGRVIMKGCVQRNFSYGSGISGKIPPRAVLEPGTAR